MSALDDLLALLASPAFLRQRLGSYKVDQMARQVIEAFKDVVVEQSGGGGGVTVYDTSAQLREVAGASLSGGESCVIKSPGLPWDNGETLALSTPLVYCKTLALSVFGLAEQDQFEPAIVVPNDVWADDKVGAWVCFGELLVFLMGDGSSDNDIQWPMPFSKAPQTEGLPEGSTYRFLTTADYPDHPNQIATWAGGDSWDYSDPQENAGYNFTTKWSLAGNPYRMFCWAFSMGGWGLHSYRSEDDTPYFIVADGLASSPAGIGRVPQVGEVFLVGKGATGDWLGQEGKLAYLDGDGSGWLFTWADGGQSMSSAIVCDPTTKQTYFASRGTGQVSTGWSRDTVTFVDDCAALRLIPTTGANAPKQGDVMVIRSTSVTMPTVGALDIPMFVQWVDLDWSIFGLPSQTQTEPALVIPDDRWAEGEDHGVGCWGNLLAISAMMGGSQNIEYPMPLNHPPTWGLQRGVRFLTGPGYVDQANRLKFATYDGEGGWTFSDADDEVSYYKLDGDQHIMVIAFENGEQPGWAYRSRNGDTPLFPMFDGMGTSPDDLPDGAKNSEVYIIRGAGTGAWAGHTNEFAWLDGNGSWLFGNDVLLAGSRPWNSSGAIVIVRERERQFTFAMFDGTQWVLITGQGSGGENPLLTPISFKVFGEGLGWSDGSPLCIDLHEAALPRFVVAGPSTDLGLCYSDSNADTVGVELSTSTYLIDVYLTTHLVHHSPNFGDIYVPTRDGRTFKVVYEEGGNRVYARSMGPDVVHFSYGMPGDYTIWTSDTHALYGPGGGSGGSVDPADIDATGADEGDVLTIEGGVPTWKAPSGGGSQLCEVAFYGRGGNLPSGNVVGIDTLGLESMGLVYWKSDPGITECRVRNVVGMSDAVSDLGLLYMRTYLGGGGETRVSAYKASGRSGPDVVADGALVGNAVEMTGLVGLSFNIGDVTRLDVGDWLLWLPTVGHKFIAKFGTHGIDTRVLGVTRDNVDGGNDVSVVRVGQCSVLVRDGYAVRAGQLLVAGADADAPGRVEPEALPMEAPDRHLYPVGYALESVAAGTDVTVLVQLVLGYNETRA